MTPLGALNFLVLQWFGVRLCASYDEELIAVDVIRPGRWWSRYAPPRDVPVSWSLLRRVWPLTGWWNNNPGQVDASLWFSLVPEAYRRDVLAVAQRVVAEHVGEKVTDELLYQLVCELNSEIWRWVGARLRGRRPGEPWSEEDRALAAEYLPGGKFHSGSSS